MPQRPRPRNYRKRQQDSDDEEQVGVAEEGGVKEAEEDSVRYVFFIRTLHLGVVTQCYL